MAGNRVSELALVIAGAGVVIAGLVLIFLQTTAESEFQQALLYTFGKEYKWRPAATSYVGPLVIAIGAMMMAFAVVVGRRWETDKPRVPATPETTDA
jgi:ABC-type phosphate transport system permease subunit